jgi:F0F1-type ATP synthase assembly protein I
MAQLTPVGLIKILGQVSVIMVVPMVGGAIVGYVVDSALGTAPLYVLVGFGLGNLIAIAVLVLYVRAGQRKYGRPAPTERGPQDDR